MKTLEQGKTPNVIIPRVLRNSISACNVFDVKDLFAIMIKNADFLFIS